MDGQNEEEKANDAGGSGNSEAKETQPRSELRDLRPEKDPMGARDKAAQESKLPDSTGEAS
jgi:hypothetical protein